MNLFKTFSLFTLFAASAGPAMAQDDFKRAPCRYPAAQAAAAKTTVASAAEENYDVKYVKLDLNMTNANVSISGNAITKAVCVVPSMPSYVFELEPPLVIDSVLIDGVLRPVTGTGTVRTVSLATPITMGTLFTAQVFYRGTPLAGTASTVRGMNNVVSPSWGKRATFTMSEAYRAKEWWPCKQALKDKIDSCDIWLTVPDTLKAGSNGLLQAVTPIDATHDRYEWKERYPIDYYLISAAVAPYVDYSFYMHFSSSTDSMLVQNYVYNNPATLPFFKDDIDSTELMIDYFSKLYTRYPFWQEKYGHCMAPLSGGMEHQTMTTQGFFEGTLTAHELGHQWFGDNVTCATWADISMNEGFASYTEYLYIDHFRTHAQALADIRDRQDNVKSSLGGSVYVDDTTSEERIFDSRLTYDKGACVLHMLRSVFNNDSIYFQTYKNYQTQFRDSTATFVDYVNVAKDVAGPVVNGISLDLFFAQWIYSEGYPIYSITWNQIGEDVYVKVDQTTSVSTSVTNFALPLELKLQSPSGDTVVRATNTLPSQVFSFKWSKPMSSMTFDPNNWLVYFMNVLTRDVTLDAQTVNTPQVRIAPNPATTGWTVQNLPDNSTLSLCDVSGRTIWTGTAQTGTASIPATQLPGGLYLLRVTANEGVRTYKLVKE
ncbi:MAG: M1 family aminopeptidase [Bacteroidota bacterium]